MTTPKYTVDKRDICIVNVESFNNEETEAIVVDLNKKGYLVSIDAEDSRSGRGVWFTTFCDEWQPSGDGNVDDYLINEQEFYCVKPTEAQVKLLGDKPIHIGNTGEYDVLIKDGALVVGCQTIPKAKAVGLCRAILKAFKVK